MPASTLVTGAASFKVKVQAGSPFLIDSRVIYGMSNQNFSISVS